MTGGSLASGRLECTLVDKLPLYDSAEAKAEASRCLYCVDAPCMSACPTGIDIPTFIHKIATDNVKGAARTIFAENLLGYSCARVCPVEVLCAGSCVYGTWGREPIRIGRLQRYATERALALDPGLLTRERRPATGRSIACIGAGPASLAAAGTLALAGHRVVIYERAQVPGGLVTSGVAPYKLHAEVALREAELLLTLGNVTLETGIEVVPGDDEGPGTIRVERLLAEHDAVFLGIGLGPDRTLGVPGEHGPGVVGATAFIERIKLDPALSLAGIERAAVIGGGNTAIDAARELAQLGVQRVTMVYRKGQADMSGYVHEWRAAQHDGVQLLEHRVPTAIVRDGARLLGVRLTSGDGAHELLHCDLVVVAIGQSRATALARAFPGVELDAHGRVRVDPATCRTDHPNVYAGGDCVNGGKEVVNAVQHGKLAARAIDRALAGAEHPWPT